MKTCSKCKRAKQLTEFALNARRIDGRQSWCKECSNSARIDYYRRNSKKEIAYDKARTKKSIQRMDEYLADKSCADCGNSNRVVLEFDHVRGKKHAAISDMVRRGYSWERIMDEVSKCEIVCANHHRIRTWARRLAAMAPPLQGGNTVGSSPTVPTNFQRKS